MTTHDPTDDPTDDPTHDPTDDPTNHHGSGRAAGVALIATSATSFGAIAIFARTAYDSGADVTTTLFLRFAIAAVVLAAIHAIRGGTWPKGRTLAALIAMGAIGYVGQSMAYFTGLTVAPAALIALLLYLYPVLVTVIARVVDRQPLTRAKVVALSLALVGTALTVGVALEGNPLGVALGLSAAAIYAVYITVGSRVTAETGPLASSTVIVAACASVYGVLVAVRGPSWPTGTAGWSSIAAIALIGTVLAITTFFAGMHRLGAADASTLSTLEPAVTVGLAALLLSEPVGPRQIVGGALILTAVVLLARQPDPAPRVATPDVGAAA